MAVNNYWTLFNWLLSFIALSVNGPSPKSSTDRRKDVLVLPFPMKRLPSFLNPKVKSKPRELVKPWFKRRLFNQISLWRVRLVNTIRVSLMRSYSRCCKNTPSNSKAERSLLPSRTNPFNHWKLFIQIPLKFLLVLPLLWRIKLKLLTLTVKNSWIRNSKVKLSQLSLPRPLREVVCLVINWAWPPFGISGVNSILSLLFRLIVAKLFRSRLKKKTVLTLSN